MSNVATAAGAAESAATQVEGQANAAPGQSTETAADPFAQFKGTKHRVPVDGKEVEVDYDELKRGYSHGRAANERLRQASEQRKAAETQTAVLKAVESGNWRPLVEKVGADKAHDFAVEFLNEYLDWQNTPEAERKAIVAEQRAKAAEDKLKSVDEEKTAQQRAQTEARVGQELDVEITEALKGHGRKPTPRLVMRIAEQMYAELEGEEGKTERVPASLALSRAVDGIHEDIAEYLTEMPADEAMKRLPKKFLDGLRKALADQVLAQDPFRSGQQTNVSDEDRPRGKKQLKRLSSKEWFERKEKQFGGR